jgi:hypothetical protein
VVKPNPQLSHDSDFPLKMTNFMVVLSSEVMVIKKSKIQVHSPVVRSKYQNTIVLKPSTKTKSNALAESSTQIQNVLCCFRNAEYRKTNVLSTSTERQMYSQRVPQRATHQRWSRSDLSSYRPIKRLRFFSNLSNRRFFSNTLKYVWNAPNY